jgi:hypothetical protein
LKELEPGPFVIDAGLSLLDRQMVDKDGMLAGKVDDVELTFPPDVSGGPGAEPPVVTAVLSGPGALAGRLRGPFDKWLSGIDKRLSPGIGRVAFGVVSRIDNHLTLAVSRHDLDTFAPERWIGQRIVDKIPGADHEAE